MSLHISLALLFAVGALHAILCVIYLKAFNSNKILITAFFSGLLDIYGYGVWLCIARLGLEGTEGSLHGIVAYACGGSVATFFILKKKSASAIAD